MPGPQNVIAAVRCWYATHGRRPVGGKEKSNEEKKLAGKWNQLLKNKLALSADHLAEAEDLLAQFDACVNRLAAWMHEHKRSPKQHRGRIENNLARSWGRYLDKPRSVAAEVTSHPGSDVEESGMDRVRSG